MNRRSLLRIFAGTAASVALPAPPPTVQITAGMSRRAVFAPSKMNGGIYCFLEQWESQFGTMHLHKHLLFEPRDDNPEKKQYDALLKTFCNETNARQAGKPR
jgi:hypothetical protein